MPPPAQGFASRLIVGPAMRTQPDRRLVALVRDGYELAFEEIVRRYRSPLSRFAASIVGSRSEDVTQDAFSKALLALRRGEEEINLRPWLFRIVRNTALNDLRDHPVAAEALVEEIAAGSTTAEAAEQREQVAELIERLRALPHAQRAAIVMRELEGLGHQEIAAALGLSAGAARQAIHRARESLRDGLGMLVPLPLLKAAMSGSGSDAAEAATGVGGALGAGFAVKATAATVLVAGAVGTGVAVEELKPRRAIGEMPAMAERRQQAVHPGGPALRQTPSGGAASEGGGGPGERGGGGPGDRHGSEQGPGDDGGHGHPGRGGSRLSDNGVDKSGPGSDRVDDTTSSNSGSGSSHGDDDDDIDDDGGDGASSGPSSGETDLEDDELRVDNSGPGSIDSSGDLEADGELDD